MFNPWLRCLAIFLCSGLLQQAAAQVGQFIWRSSTIGGGGFCLELRFAPPNFFGLSSDRSLYLATDVSGVYRSNGIVADTLVMAWERLHDEYPASADDILPRYTTTLAFTTKYDNTSRLIAGSSEGIFAWSNQTYKWEMTTMPDRAAIGATMHASDGRYPWIGVIREVPVDTRYLAAGIGNIRAVVENTGGTTPHAGLGAVLRSDDGGKNWELVPVDGALANEVVHDLDYITRSDTIHTFVTTDSALYFSSDLFQAASGSAVSFQKIRVKKTATKILNHLLNCVVLEDATPNDNLTLFASICSTDTGLGGVYWINTTLPDLGNGLDAVWTKMPRAPINDYTFHKNLGRLGAKPGSVRTSFELFVSKYNVPFLAAANHTNKKWKRIAGPINNVSHGYREGNDILKFGNFTINPQGLYIHPSVYGCWEYGSVVAAGHNDTSKATSHQNARRFRQTFSDSMLSPGPELGRAFYKSRGLDELWFTGQKMVFKGDTLMIGSGDNHLLRSLDRGRSWSSRFLRGQGQWKLDYGTIQQHVRHVAFHPENSMLVLASASPGNQATPGEGELLRNKKGGAGDSLTWVKLAGGISGTAGLPNGEVHDFTFDKRSPKKGLFVAVRFYGIYYGTVETNGTVSSSFVKITDTNLTDKIRSDAGRWHNYSRLEFDPDSSDILYVARHWPAGGVFRIRLGFNASTGQRLPVSSSDFIKSVDEVITASVDPLGAERTPRDSTAASDVINLLITKDHVFAGVTCGDTLDLDNVNYCGGLVQWAKTAQPENYFWRIGGPSAVGGTSRTIAIGGLSQDPLYPDTIFAVTHRFTLKADRDIDQLFRGEENYKPMHVWRSVDAGATFNKLEYWQSEHRFPEAVTMAFFPDSPDSMVMPTHGN
ncbi:hypothetical protein HUU05_09560, partial [candidate division KSB1 bacterium]|nr:hypothetical protein [candidate division KSB1 bacterium]